MMSLSSNILNSIQELEKDYDFWLSNTNPTLIFLSMVLVKLLDLFSAWLVFLINPGIFLTGEANITIKRAFAFGEVYPLIFQEIIAIAIFSLLTVGIWWFSKRENNYFSKIISLIPVVIGVFSLWIFPLAIGTNIINGILILGVSMPFSAIIYALIGFPLSFILLQKFWKVGKSKSFIISFLGLIILGLFF